MSNYFQPINLSRNIKNFILVSRNFFSGNLILKVGVKMILRMITKNHTPDPEIGFLTKSILKPYGRAYLFNPKI